jgi:nicotinic acid mononucleotide adenylyltransferase
MLSLAEGEEGMSSLTQERIVSDRKEGEVFSEVTAVEGRIDRELSQMQQTLGANADLDAFADLGRWTHSTLARIGELMARGFINPAGRGHLASGRERLGRRHLRLGVFPTAGNPLHWGHLLSGLAAMERFQLDKVIYVIAGDDPRKPYLAPAELRHRIAKEVIRLFHPLFDYSPIALGGTAPGEINLFRIMTADGMQPLHAFYLAGSDHFHRYAPQTGEPDTIQKLEEGVRRRVHGFNPRLHRLSAVFLDRGDRSEPVETFLDVRWIAHLPLKTSSTRIRRALEGNEPLHELTALPFTAYCAICEHGELQSWPSNGELICGADESGDSLPCLQQDL